MSNCVTYIGVDKIALGSKIRDLREAKGLSQEELAGKARVARRALQRLELGLNSPTLDTLEAITSALGAPLVELFASGVSKRPAAKDQELLIFELIDAWRAAGTQARALGLYFLTGSAKHLRLVALVLQPEAELIRTHLGQIGGISRKAR